MNIRFTDDMNPARAGKVADVLRGERLWIPTADDYGGVNHARWVAKAEAELAQGERFAILATSDGRGAGALVWRPGDKPGQIDLRNISITPDMRGRHLGAFCMNQLFFLAKEYVQQTEEQQSASELLISVDTKETNLEMITFLANLGFTVEEIRDLYGGGKKDVVMRRRVALAA